MQVGRLSNKAIRLRCPPDTPLGKTWSNFLLPFTAAAILSERDLAHRAPRQPGTKGGLEWEISQNRADPGPLKSCRVTPKH